MSRPLKCKSCGAKAAIASETCPKCGRRYASTFSRGGKIIISLAVLAAGLTCVLLLMK